MLYNYLALNSLGEWPKEKATKLMSLLNIKDESDFDKFIIEMKNNDIDN